MTEVGTPREGPPKVTPPISPEGQEHDRSRVESMGRPEQSPKWRLRHRGPAPHRGPGPPQRAEREPAVSTEGTQLPGACRLLREDVEAAGRRELMWES